MSGMNAKEGCGPCCGECEGIDADFSYEYLGSNTYQFTDESTPSTGETIDDWLWEVLDGADCTGSVVTSSSDENPAINMGSNTWIRLTITDSNGCTDSICKALCVCDDGGPIAGFHSNQVDDDPCTFDFFDDSIGGSCDGTIVEWEWKCNDTVFSTDQNPEGIDLEDACDDATGPWDVTLLVTDEFGCQDSVVATIYCNTVPVDCCQDAGALPGVIEVTSSGWSNNTCAAAGDCSVFNGTHTLTWDGIQYKSADLGDGCGSIGQMFIVASVCDPTGLVVVFDAGFSTEYSYAKSLVDIDCRDTHTLPFSIGATTSCHKPSSVSVTIP